MDKKYVECLKCGTIHYVVDKKEANLLGKEGHLIEEFSNRNLSYCCSCGTDNFSKINDDYVDDFAFGEHIQPVLIEKG